MRDIVSPSWACRFTCKVMRHSSFFRNTMLDWNSTHLRNFIIRKPSFLRGKTLKHKHLLNSSSLKWKKHACDDDFFQCVLCLKFPSFLLKLNMKTFFSDCFTKIPLYSHLHIFIWISNIANKNDPCLNALFQAKRVAHCLFSFMFHLCLVWFKMFFF